jgi:hypothetical protein
MPKARRRRKTDSNCDIHKKGRHWLSLFCWNHVNDSHFRMLEKAPLGSLMALSSRHGSQHLTK